MQPTAPKAGSNGPPGSRFGRRGSSPDQSDSSVLAPSVPGNGGTTEYRGTASFRFSRSRSKDSSVGPSVSMGSDTNSVSPLHSTPIKRQLGRRDEGEELVLSPFHESGGSSSKKRPVGKKNNSTISPSPKFPRAGGTIVASKGSAKKKAESGPTELLLVDPLRGTAICEFCIQSVPKATLGDHLNMCSVCPPALESANTRPHNPRKQQRGKTSPKPRPTKYRKRPTLSQEAVEMELFGPSSCPPPSTAIAAGGPSSVEVSKAAASLGEGRILITCAVCRTLAPVLATTGATLQSKLCDADKRRIHFVSSCDHPVCTQCLYGHFEVAVQEETRSAVLHHLQGGNLSNSSIMTDARSDRTRNSIESTASSAGLNPRLLTSRSGLRLDLPDADDALDMEGSRGVVVTKKGLATCQTSSLMFTPCPVGECSAVLGQADLRQLLPLSVVEGFLNRSFVTYITEQLAHTGRSGYLKCPCCSTVVQRQVVSDDEDDLYSATPERTISGPKRVDTLIRVNQVPVQTSSTVSSFMVDGRIVDLAAKQHYDEYRLRCGHCMSTFCHSCSEAPYHTGVSCDQHKARVNALKCRFCDDTAAPPPPTGFFGSLFRKNRAVDVCNASECVKRAEKVCHKTLPCGHPCRGVSEEDQCPPCLEEGCVDNTTNQCGGDFCSICYVDELSVGGCIKLGCGHVFHLDCVKQKIERKWPSARITFSFLNCPTCSKPIAHPLLNSLLKENLKFKELVKSKVILRMEHEGLSNADVVNNPDSEYYQDPVRYGEDMLAYYPCFKCHKPYFGGFKRCEAVADDDQFDASELVCSGCVPNEDMRICRIHGTDFIEYKCRFCCSIAQWYCWGTTHFCTSCHRRQELGDYLTKKRKEDLPKCDGKRSCPLGVDHPPTGTEHAMGCAMCRKNKESANF